MPKQADDYTWFIHPKNIYTNLAVANVVEPENFISEAEVEDGSKLPLWRMDRWQQVEYLISDPDSKFHLYNRQGRYGKIRRVDFMQKKRDKNGARAKIEEMFAKLGLTPPPQLA
jgi:hypothetical protein